METPKWRRRALVLLPILLVTVAFVLARPRLVAMIGGPMVGWVGAAMAIFVVSHAIYFSIRVHRGQDEVQKAGDMFSARWGFTVGTMAFVLLLWLPPFRDLAVDLIREWAGDPDASRTVVLRAVTFGFGGVVILQAIGATVMKAIWWKDKQ